MAALSRSPLAQRPQRRAILVESQVSSRNTSPVASSAGWLARQASRSACTSGRSCSAACALFFEAQPHPLQRIPQRTDADLDAVRLPQPSLQLRQGRVPHLGHPPPQHILTPRQDRLALTAARLGRALSRRSQPLSGFRHVGRANPKPLRHVPDRPPRLQHPLPQVLRIRLATLPTHRRTLLLPITPESHPAPEGNPSPIPFSVKML